MTDEEWGEIAPDDIDEALPTTLIAAPAPPLIEVLSADAPLPILTKFVPDPRWKLALEVTTRDALAADVTTPGGLQKAAVALADVKAAIKTCEDGFAEPIAIANRLHKGMTATRAEWTKDAEEAAKVVGGRIYTEQKRLEGLELERRRKAQAEADRIAKEEAKRTADLAEKAHAPAQVVLDLKAKAETAKAAPVEVLPLVPKLAGTTTVQNWKARPALPVAGEEHPKVAEMNAGELRCLHALLTAILEGKAPVTAIEVNYSVLDSRAKSDKSTFNIPGFEAFDAGGTRSTRGRK